MTIRLFLCGIALFLAVASGFGAEGKYQRTNDRKTLVWNPDPKPEDAAAWSGDRDADGYATGYGTLTWYRIERTPLTGSNLDKRKDALVSRYSGTMAKGKWDGTVTTVDHRKTFHAKFADGVKQGTWAEGPAPSPPAPRMAQHEPSQPTPEIESRRRSELIEAPAEGPSPAVPQPPAAEKQTSPAAEATRDISAGESSPAPVEKPDAKPTVAEKSRGNDSLRSLAMPPSSLQTHAESENATGQSSPPAISSSPAMPTSLTSAEVIGLADAEAHSQGYDVAGYDRPQVEYSAIDGTWSVSYDQRSGTARQGKHFTVTVDDKTKKAAIGPVTH